MFCFVAGNEGDTPMFPRPRPHLSWLKISVFVRRRPLRLTEVEQDEERCLDSMLHWHDPLQKARTLRCRRHTLVDDNPASG